ncbi:MAG: alpha/beta hydrolase [Bryobacteraceae bacterium]|nr:alpha/beta hydrolase [Bryobacteraceae bacterium]
MVVTPLQLLAPLLLGIIAVLMIATSIYLLRRAALTPAISQPIPEGTLVKPMAADDARSRRRVLVGIALGLLVWIFAGRSIAMLVRPHGDDLPQDEFGPVTRRVTGPSGAELAVEESGPQGAPRLIFTHGWGADRREWSYARQELADRYRVVTWDLPGLGQSKPIPDLNYALENMAGDLKAVVESTGDSPAILVGHSIGGMINLTLCKLNQGNPGPNVAGIVQLNTSYTNPVRTVQGHQISEALQKPVYEPLLHLITFASPVVRALSWLSYQSGLTHLQNASSSFAGAETREQLDFASKYYYRSSPAIVARGTLGMMNWDATDVLSRIQVPVLIISGDQDTTTLPSASDRMAQEIPRNVRQSVNPAAHLGPIEQHERYNTAIGAFAASRFSGEGAASRKSESQ